MLGQEAVADKSTETTAIPVLLERLGADDGLKGALVTIDAIATNPTIATAIRQVGADYLLAVKANQPTLRGEVERYFDDAPSDSLDRFTDLDKGHGRIEERAVIVSRETGWLAGDRRFPGELRLPDATTIIRVRSRPVSRTGADSIRDTESHLPILRPSWRRRPCEAIGWSRTRCTGPSISSSGTISRGSEKATEPSTWQSSATSPSISSGPSTTSDPSGSGERRRLGAPTTSLQSSDN